MDSMHREGRSSTTGMGLLSPGSSLIVNSRQPRPNDMKSSTGPGCCRPVLTSIEREQTRFNKEKKVHNELDSRLDSTASPESL